MVKEQDSNFITRLHKGQISIIPWPIIESDKFYSMFHRLRKVLYSQPVTHPSAGAFLSTMKTLMAKLKVCSSLVLLSNMYSHSDTDE